MEELGRSIQGERDIYIYILLLDCTVTLDAPVQTPDARRRIRVSDHLLGHLNRVEKKANIAFVLSCRVAQVPVGLMANIIERRVRMDRQTQAVSCPFELD